LPGGPSPTAIRRQKSAASVLPAGVVEPPPEGACRGKPLAARGGYPQCPSYAIPAFHDFSAKGRGALIYQVLAN
jgi:hypothetical protein